jgi:hypothetical protein
MDTIYVQFEDSTEAKIVALFGSEQDHDVYPNQGAVPSSDHRYKQFYDALDAFARSAYPIPAA